MHNRCGLPLSTEQRLLDRLLRFQTIEVQHGLRARDAGSWLLPSLPIASDHSHCITCVLHTAPHSLLQPSPPPHTPANLISTNSRNYHAGCHNAAAGHQQDGQSVQGVTAAAAAPLESPGCAVTVRCVCGGAKDSRPTTFLAADLPLSTMQPPHTIVQNTHCCLPK